MSSLLSAQEASPTTALPPIRINRRLSQVITPLLHEIADEPCGPIGRNFNNTSRTIQPHGMQPAISWATEKGYKSLVRLLLKRGVDIDTLDPITRTPPLTLAIYYGRISIARVLITNGATFEFTINGKVNHALMVAIKKKAVGIARLLIQAGADPNYSQLESTGYSNTRF